MRKLFVALSTTLAIIASLFTAASPASALYHQSTWTTVASGIVGQGFQMTNSCYYDAGDPVRASQYTFTSGELPPGITLDEWSGTFSGTPTTAGTFIIDGYSCASGNSTIGGGSNPITFTIGYTDQPYMTVTPLNDASCSVRVSVFVANDGRAYANNYVSAEFNGAVREYAVPNLDPHTGYTFDVSTTTWEGTNPLGGDSISARYSDGNMGCGDAVDWKFHAPWRTNGFLPIDDYALVSGVVATTTFVTPATPMAPFVSVDIMNDSACSVQVTTFIPGTPETGSVRLTVDNSGLGTPYVMTLADPGLGVPKTIDFAVTDPTSLADTDVVSITGDQTLACGDTINFSLEYSVAGMTSAPAAFDNVVPTAPIPAVVPYTSDSYTQPTATISAINDPYCSIRVQGQFPIDTQNLLRSYVQFLVGGNYVMEITPTTQNSDGTFDMTYQLLGDNHTNTTTLDPAVNGTSDYCGSTVEVILGYFRSDLTVIDALAIPVTTNTPELCTVGTFSLLGTAPCTNSPAGYFVPTIGATEPTACPAGMYTLFSGEEECTDAQTGHFVAEEGSTHQTRCEPGTYSPDPGASECDLAEPGTYAPDTGMSMVIPCAPGRFEPEYGSHECLTVPMDYFSGASGATVAVPCPTGKVTWGEGSVSVYECFTPFTQKINVAKLPAKMKFKAALTLSTVTDQGFRSNYTVSGGCTASATTTVMRLDGQSIRVPAIKVTAGSRAANCVVRISNAGDHWTKPFAIAGTIKVTKTGK